MAALPTPPARPAHPGVFAGLAAAALALALAQLIYGPVRLSLPQIAAVFLGEPDRMSDAIVWSIRLPRLLLGVAVGVALALAGAALQGVLRNPLADPGLIGVTGGASLGAVIVIVLGAQIAGGLPAALRPWLLPMAAFLGAGIVTALVFALSRRATASGVGVNAALLILAGVAVNAIAGAGIGVMVYLSDDMQLRDFTFWTMGGLASANWALTLIALAAAGIAAGAILGLARALDLFQLGERAAFHAGLPTERIKTRIALTAALGVGAATAAAGPIGFIGLVAPHMARLLVGPAHRHVLPAAALLGAVLVLGADLLVRNAVPPAEPPIGLATSLIGGPFFLWLLLTRMKGRIGD